MLAFLIICGAFAKVKLVVSGELSRSAILPLAYARSSG